MFPTNPKDPTAKVKMPSNQKAIVIQVFLYSSVNWPPHWSEEVSCWWLAAAGAAVTASSEVIEVVPAVTAKESSVVQLPGDSWLPPSCVKFPSPMVTFFKSRDVTWKLNLTLKHIFFLWLSSAILRTF